MWQGVFRSKITGSNGYAKAVKYTIDTATYALNSAGIFGIFEGGQGGMNDDFYLYTMQEITPATTMAISSWTADKESASLTLSSNILTSGANMDLVNITDNAGTVIPTTKTVDLNKITFVRQGELPFALDMFISSLLVQNLKILPDSILRQKRLNKSLCCKRCFLMISAPTRQPLM